jgi:hypothetical protein
MTPDATESGQAGFEVIVGIALLFCFALGLSNLWIVMDAKTTATSAARVGTQAFIEQNSLDEAKERAEEEVEYYLQDRFVHEVRYGDDSFARCTRVTVTVELTIPLFTVPFIGIEGGKRKVTGTHHSRVDPYRNNVPGEANCA